MKNTPITENLSARAGRYVSQPEGYRAFIPAPLPPDPPVRADGELLALLSEAAGALGYLNGSVGALPNADMFVPMYVLKEAVLSSRIEGIRGSLLDALEAEAEIFPPRIEDVNEIISCAASINLGLDLLKDSPVSISTIRRMHERLFEGIRRYGLYPGELRTVQNWIGYAGSSIREAKFVPPPPGEVPRNLEELERFFRSAELPPLISIGMIHVQFEAIHPFVDGNGRVGRALVSLLLSERGILQKPVLYLSRWFMKHRGLYYDRLQGVHDRGDWEGWLNFFLQGVKETAYEAAATGGRIVALRERHRNTVAENLGGAAGNGLRVLDRLYERPIVSVKEIQSFTGTTYTAANNLVARMTGIGILHEITGRVRNRRFMYKDYAELFSSDGT